MLDMFNNPIDPEVDYARGKILASSIDEKKKYQNAVRIIAERLKAWGEDSFYIFTGNIRNNALLATDLGLMSEEWVGQAVYQEDLRLTAIKHVSGCEETDGVAVFNRTSAANVATALALGGPGRTMISAAPQQKHHPSVRRGAALSQSRLECVSSAEELRALNVDADNAFCLITSVTSELLYFNEEEMKALICAAKEKGLTVVVDDAYGARLRPIVFGYTPSLKAGADAVSTNNDKAGLNGPRAGIMVGRRDLVTRIHSKAFALGMEGRAPLCLAVYRSLSKFTPKDLLEEVKAGEELYESLHRELGDEFVRKSLLGPEITGESVLRLALRIGGQDETKSVLVPNEASSALGMELLERYGVVTTNACGMPGARISVRFKTNRETLDKIGGADAVTEMFLDAATAVSKYTNDIDTTRRVLTGE